MLCEGLEPRRLMAAGTPDVFFGNGGTALQFFDAPETSISDIAALPGGGYVAVGTIPGGQFGQQLLVARYTSAGRLDPTFSDDGLATDDDLLRYLGDAMKYAAVPPMPAVFGITIAVIVTGALVAIASLVSARMLQKRKKE